MFFINCEELNQGHLTAEETKPWMDLIAGAKKSLTEIGVTTSINPWVTLLHCDRGRRLKEGQNFTLMVDASGRRATAQVCPLCPEWRKYIKKIYSLYASVKPWMVWVEDDFRLHNHSPLTRGGCFCDLHMKEFSRAARKKLKRDEFFKGIVKTGSPHKYRRIWLDLNRKIMTETAGIIGNAVHSVSPETMVGLMSSHPAVHCAEGRDWNGILSGLAGKTRKVNRPHLPAYLEDTPSSYLWNFSGISTYTQASIPDDTDIYPELDNHCVSSTRFTKSHQASAFQITLSLVMGIKGITMNIFDMMGNGPNLSENWQEFLKKRKAFYNEVCALGLNLKSQQGVKVLFSSDASYNIHTGRGKGMEELYPNETFWAQILSCFGIANRFTRDHSFKNEVVAVSGQYFRNLPRQEIRNLFKNNFVILEAGAAETLFEIGMEDLIKAKTAKWIPQDSGITSYEEMVGGKYFGISNPRFSAQVSAGDFLKIEYEGDADLQCLSVVKSPEGKPKGKGMVVGKNFFLLPYGHFPAKPVSHLTPFRQKVLQEVLKEHSFQNDTLTFTLDLPYLPVYRYEFPDKTVLMVVNCSTDDIKGFGLFAKNLKIKKDRCLVLDSKTGKGQKADFFLKDDVYYWNLPVESMEAKVIICRK